MLGKFFECEADTNGKYYRVFQPFKHITAEDSKKVWDIFKS